MLQQQLLTFWNQPNFISRKIRVAGKMLYFHTMENPQSKTPIRLPRSVPKVQIDGNTDSFTLLSNYQWVTIRCKEEEVQGTMLQKLSKCEVKAWLCRSLIILLPLQFHVKSNLGEFKQFKKVIFGNFRGSEFWFLVIFFNFETYFNKALCSRNFQNVKLRLDFVEVWSFYCHSNFT